MACEFGQCVAEPVMAIVSEYMAEADRLYASTRETSDPAEIESLIARARQAEEDAQRVSRELEKMTLCKVCPYSG